MRCSRALSSYDDDDGGGDVQIWKKATETRCYRQILMLLLLMLSAFLLAAILEKGSSAELIRQTMK
jgi:hypothetical protein